MPLLCSSILSAAHLKALGSVAAEWSYTEMALEQMIWDLLSVVGDAGYAVTTHIGSETRLHILESLANKYVTDADHKKTISKIVAEIRRLRTERNNIVHAVWLQNIEKRPFPLLKLHNKGRKPTAQLIKVTAKGKVKISNTPCNTKKILAVAAEINALLNTIHDYLGVRAASKHRLAIEKVSQAVIERQKPVPVPGPIPTAGQAPAA